MPEPTALTFAQYLIDRDYAAAHAMTTPAYQQTMTVEAFQDAFEYMCPPGWDFGPGDPLEVVMIMTDLPHPQPGDQAWVYVAISGDVYSEAVAVIVCRHDDALAIREVEFGRP